MASITHWRNAHIPMHSGDGQEPGLFDIVVCEPRTEYAASWPISGIEIDAGMPDDVAIARIIDSQCAVVALTHDPKLDDLAILAALPSSAFYVGALGSAQTNAKRHEHLAELGMTRNQSAYSSCSSSGCP